MPELGYTEKSDRADGLRETRCLILALSEEEKSGSGASAPKPNRENSSQIAVYVKEK